eukprot:SAG11_NODE_252_length_11593_cov_7.436663_4_plen_206_part_00
MHNGAFTLNTWIFVRSYVAPILALTHASLAVVALFSKCFDEETHYYMYPLARVALYAQRVARAAVADANKAFLLEAPGSLDRLVDGLLLDAANPRRGQELQQAIAELQQICAGTLQELALSAVGEEAIKSDSRAMGALQALRSAGLTSKARQCAAGALFKLERSGGSDGAGDGDNAATKKHLMVSYQCELARVRRSICTCGTACC